MDALSPSGRFGITLIGFVGSVFSPRYRAARMRGVADPLDHCAMNVAVYRPGGARWCLTEWPRERVRRAACVLQLGPNRWERNRLGWHVTLNERSVPWPRPVRGEVHVAPCGPGLPQPLAMDLRGGHHWWPLAPLARVEVSLDEPPLRFVGRGYLDCNYGDAPLEADLRSWWWCRSVSEEQACVVYDALLHNGARKQHCLRFSAGDAGVAPLPPVAHELGRGRWGMPRPVRIAPGQAPQVARVLEDTPFYTRSVLTGLEEAAQTVHESVCLSRFVQPWVQRLLPFRIRRGHG